MRIALAIAFLLATAPIANAESMSCTASPMHPYFVTFDPASRQLLIDPETDRTSYAVVHVQPDLVLGDVGHGSGLLYVASFDAPKSITYYDGKTGKVAQIDACR